MDPSPAVRQLAEYLLRYVIAIKAPLLAYNHFVEALFMLNGCTAGLHGARLGANMGAGGVSSGRQRPGGSEMSDHEGEQQAQQGEGGVVDDGGGEDGHWMAAPAQFTLTGKHKRCVCVYLCWHQACDKLVYIEVSVAATCLRFGIR